MPLDVKNDVLPFFSVCMSEQNIFIATFNSSGNLFLSKLVETYWSSKALLQINNVSPKTKPFAIITKTRMTLICNTESSLNYIQFENGKVTKSEVLDTFSPMAKYPYSAFKTFDGNYFVCYKTRENTIKTILLDSSGNIKEEPNQLIPSSVMVQKASFLEFNSSIHTVYSTKNMFSTQVYYRFKINEMVSPPKKLWEGQRLEKFIMFGLNGTLWICLYINSNMYYLKQEKGIFSPLYKYKGYVPKSFSECEYICSGRGNGEICSNEAFMDSNSDIILFPHICPSFYTPKNIVHQSEIKEQENESEESKAEEQKETNQSMILRNQIRQYEAMQKESLSQMAYYSQVLANKNEEISRMNQTWRMRLDALKKENDELKEKLNRFMSLQSEEKEPDVPDYSENTE